MGAARTQRSPRSLPAASASPRAVHHRRLAEERRIAARLRKVDAAAASRARTTPGRAGRGQGAARAGGQAAIGVVDGTDVRERRARVGRASGCAAQLAWRVWRCRVDDIRVSSLRVTVMATIGHRPALMRLPTRRTVPMTCRGQEAGALRYRVEVSHNGFGIASAGTRAWRRHGWRTALTASQYQCRIVVVRRRGGGQPSPWSRDTPQAATHRAVQLAGCRRTTLKWAAPADNGAAVEQYELEWDGGAGRAASGVDAASAEQGNVQSRRRRRGPPGPTYRFRLRCQNAVGWSPHSAAASTQRCTPIRGAEVWQRAAQEGGG